MKDRRFGKHDKPRHLTHGESKVGHWSPEYRIWAAMLRRCDSPSQASYKYYGARGIRVCERWKKFENFLADMGRRPPGIIKVRARYQIDRINSDGNYEPSNCRWAPARANRGGSRRKHHPLPMPAGVSE